MVLQVHGINYRPGRPGHRRSDADRGSWVAGGGWWALAIVGLVPLAAGVLDICLFNVLFGQPLSGKAVRAS